LSDFCNVGSARWRVTNILWTLEAKEQCVRIRLDFQTTPSSNWVIFVVLEALGGGLKISLNFRSKGTMCEDSIWFQNLEKFTSIKINKFKYFNVNGWKHGKICQKK